MAKAISGTHVILIIYQPTFIRTIQKNTDATDAKFSAKFLRIAEKILEDSLD